MKSSNVPTYQIKTEGQPTRVIQGDSCSDGYHTFDELYDHRNMLFIVLCVNTPSYSYWVPNHYEGWDLLVIDSSEIGQLSYHVPIKLREHYQNKLQVKSDHVFDGHTSADVLKRLEGLL